MQKIIFTFLLLFCLYLESYAVDYDAVYVINLDRNPERMSKMKKQLDAFGIKFKRFKAVDGYKIKILNIKTGKTEDNKLFYKECDKNSEYLISSESFSFKYIPTNGRVLCCGELGCALSHLSIIKDIAKNNYNNAIIFEDDILFESNFKNLLTETLKNTPEHTDVLFLDIGVCYNYSSPYFVSAGALLTCFEQIPNNKYVVKLNDDSGRGYGAHAYVITNRAAKEILKNSQIIRSSIDNHIIMDKRFSYLDADANNTFLARSSASLVLTNYKTPQTSFSTTNSGNFITLSGKAFVLTVVCDYSFSSAFVKKLFSGGSNTKGKAKFLLWGRGVGICN